MILFWGSGGEGMVRGVGWLPFDWHVPSEVLPQSAVE